MNDLFLKALRCQNSSRPPVWLMRQAGRYMQDYRKMREKHSFWEMVSEPELAKKVTLMPIKTFGMDAAILFSDILVIPNAMGSKVNFVDGVGPIFEKPLSTVQEVEKIRIPHVEDSLAHVFSTIRALREELRTPLIGFCGAPFTIASYMIEGKSSKDFKKTKEFLFHEPKSFHALLDKITTFSIDYLLAQIKAGVQAVQIFDSWANVLSHSHFEECSSFYLKKIIEALQPTGIPLLFFCRGGLSFSSLIVPLAPQGISLDWTVNLRAAREVIPKTIALQGNLDPSLLLAPLKVLEQHVSASLKSMRGDPGYIFNLGHGVLPETPVDSVKFMIDQIKEFS